MTKKHEARPSGDEKGRRRQLEVICSDGTRQRFLRGMITRDLVQRGLSFEDAYAVARAVRDALSDRDEVSTSEVRDLVTERLEKTLGGDLLERLVSPARPVSEIRVVYEGQEQPFSRGLLARSVYAAGVGLDRAYGLLSELEAELRGEGVKRLEVGEIARRVGDLLEREEGAEAARRYRTVRRIGRLPRPLVLYIGGASGTGKSTVALELAPLLRIYRINATDTIRQVMRMVFTPSILPAIHSSSFEVAPLSEPGAAELGSHSPGDPEFARRLIATYEEQAVRVNVGIRAVVERAIAENLSIIVEGVHVHPALVPFADLGGSAYQVPLVLASLNEESHRSRFLARARTHGRRAERYLENFASIRAIHDHIVQEAERRDVPILDNPAGDPPVLPTLQLVTGMLEHTSPGLGLAERRPVRPAAPTLLLVIDGLADRPVRALGGRTPLQAAETPTLDRLAREGQCGLADPVAPGVVPDTAAGSLALFGQSPLALKRGPTEALGANLTLEPGDVALRANFATLGDDGLIIDRRAGRIREGARELTASLDRLPLPGGPSRRVEVLVRPATEHRLCVVLRGPGLSSAIQGSDPGEGAVPSAALIPRPDDPEDAAAVYTANVLALFEQQARRVLADHRVNRKRRRESLPEANAILTRGAGRVHRLLPLEEAGIPLRLCCISGDHTVLGLARWAGARTITGPEMTANLDTDLQRKFDVAFDELRRNDLVILHLKGADIAAHDQRPDLKVSFLEAVDQQLAGLLARVTFPVRVAVASDHATLSESGQHAADPPPVLIWGEGVEADEVETFDEQAAASGRLQRFPLQLLLSRLYELS
jgi:2,3-bisphosphoglycerate-independent phosphoglycerate mutase